MSDPTTDLQAFLERARQTGAYRVIEFYEKSYLPYVLNTQQKPLREKRRENNAI